MAKLQVSNKTYIQPEVSDLIHDVVLSLCQRKYSSLSSVEIDGIICISLQGYGEQQVIKIHEILDAGSKVLSTDAPKSDDTRTSENSNRNNEIDLHLEVESINEKNKGDQNDEISNHFTEQHSNNDNVESINFRNDISFLSSLLKSTNSMIVNEQASSGHKVKKVRNSKNESKEKRSKRKRKHPIHHPKSSPKKVCTDESLTDDITQSLDHTHEIINQNMVVVKQEVPDEEEETHPKIVDIYCANNIHPEGEPFASGSQLGHDTQQNSASKPDDRPSQDLLHQALELRRSASVEKQQGDDQSQLFSNPDRENTNLNLVIKQEKADDADFVAAYGEMNQNENKLADETTALNHDFDDDPDYVPFTDDQARGYSSSSDTCRPRSKKTTDGAKKQKSKKKKESTSAKNWFETVKSNMNRYQAALMKSVQITKKGIDTDRQITDEPFVQREFLDDRNFDDRIVPKSGDTPVLKSILETSCEETHEKDSSASSTNPSAVVKSENVQESKPDEPKLGSKYPALFSQLQKAKTVENQCDSTSQDSLVNRLPFLSFKDLFAQASPNGSPSGIDMRPSPERLADLLSRPSASAGGQSIQQNHHNVGNSAAGCTKKTWNWKRRAVRPKGPNGEILMHIPPRYPNSDKANIPVGIANPKRQKSKSKEEDRDWHPHHADTEVLSQVREGVSTRQSSGRYQRTNFTEYSDSDIEEIDLEDDETEEPIELVSAYCKFSCGARFDSVDELRVHEETCSMKGFKCDFC